jgi:hypothetical protein
MTAIGDLTSMLGSLADGSLLRLSPSSSMISML